MLKAHLILAILWILFCVFHSLLASNDIKRSVAVHLPRFSKNYRFFYTLFSFASLAVVLIYQIRLDTPSIINKSFILDAAGIIIGITGMAIMAICIRKYFLSLSGLKSLVSEHAVANELRVDGIHQYVRHPLYLGTFLFIWGLWLIIPNLSILIANIIITVYTLIGIRLEERKLVDEFGESYRAYRRRVPMIFPLFR